MRKLKTSGLIALMVFCVLCLSACQESTEAKYDRARKLLTEEKYFEASILFDDISSYEDSSKVSTYAKAIAVAENGDYDAAVSNFIVLGDFKDSSMMVTYYTGRKYERQADATNWSLWVTAAEYYDMANRFLDSEGRAEACRKAVYDKAVQLAGNGEFGQSIVMLNALSSYNDSSDLKKYYTAFKLEQEEKIAEAAEVFKELGDYRNSEEQVGLVLQRGYDKADVLEKAGNQEEASVIFASLGDYEDSFERANKPFYDLGLAKREEKDWYAAIQAFEKAGAYSDAETQILETRYQQAEYKREQNNWEEAVRLFTDLGEYKDSVLQVNETYYQQANAMEEKGDREGAYHLFTSLGRYKDAYDRANKPYYELGVAKREAQEWDEAVAAFTKIIQYNDVADQINETYYQQASAMEKAGDQNSAYELFISLGEYKDSYERANRPYYELGVAKREAGKWDDAVEAFTHIITYSDAAEQINATYYAEGEAKREAQDWEGARIAFENAGKYTDAIEQIAATWYAEGKAKREAQDWEGARTAFENAGEYTDAKAQIAATWYAEGATKRETQDWDGARIAFENAGEYSDAATQIKETSYREATAIETNDPEKAISIYTALGKYGDANEKVKKLWYDMGLKKKERKEWNEAINAFIQAEDYSDAQAQIPAIQFLEGETKRAGRDWDGAIEAYRAAGDYDKAAHMIEECLYQKTIELYEKTKIGDASNQQTIDSLLCISDPQLFSQARDILYEGKVFNDVWASEFAEGNTIDLGRYEQDNDPADGPETISWKVICSQAGRALLLSEKVIDAMPFMPDKRRTELNDLDADEIWKQSEICQWMNQVFSRSFSEQETAMLTTHETGDLFFILDNKEYKQYCGEEASNDLTATDYALSKDIQHHDLLYYSKVSNGTRVPGTAVTWWIRTGAIKEGGYLYPDDLGVIAGVRPAVWFSFEQGPTMEWVESYYPIP